MYSLDHIWLIPLFPAFGAACMFFFGRKLPKSAVSGICVGMVALAFAWACLAVWQYNGYAAANPGKDTRRIEVRQAQPVDGTVHADQRSREHVADDAVVLNGLVARLHVNVPPSPRDTGMDCSL